MNVISKIIGFILSGYPYFSLLYLIIFWKKIKSISVYKEILSLSNLIFAVLSIKYIYLSIYS